MASNSTTLSESSKKIKITFFTSAEIEERKCDMKRASILEKLPDLRDDLEMRHEVIAELL